MVLLDNKVVSNHGHYFDSQSLTFKGKTMTIRRDAATTAKLILLNAKLYEDEREKEITRYRFSRQTLERIAGLKAIRPSFITELEDELAYLGWQFFSLGGDYGVLNVSKTVTWVKLSSKRLDEQESSLLNASADIVEQKYAEIFSADSIESVEE